MGCCGSTSSKNVEFNHESHQTPPAAETKDKANAPTEDKSTGTLGPPAPGNEVTSGIPGRPASPAPAAGNSGQNPVPDRTNKAALQRKQQSLKEMREDLARQPTVFMLNNLIMAVEFFADYQKDREEIRRKKKEEEAKMTRKLLPNKMAGWYMGALYEQLAMYVRQKPNDGMVQEGIIGTLDNFITHEFISVEDDFNKAEPDSSAYVMKMMAVEREGNFELQVLRAPRGSGQMGADDSDDYAGSTGSSGVERDFPASSADAPGAAKKKRSKLKSSRPSLNSSPSSALDSSDDDLSTHSGGDVSRRRFLNGDDFDSQPEETTGMRRVASSGIALDRLTVASRANSLASFEAHSSYSVDEEWEGEFYANALTDGVRKLSKSCFRRTHLQPTEDDVIPGWDVPKRTLEEITVLSSSGFYQYFTRQSFQKIAEKLGVSSADLQYRKVQPPGIKYSSFEGRTLVEFTCTPTIPVLFLPRQCFEWKQRERAGKWPPTDILNRAEAMGCNLVPTGILRSADNKVVNKWDVRFTQLENDLLLSLPYGQVRCFIVCNLIHNAYLKNIAWSPGSESIWLHWIFWTTENKLLTWKQDRLGGIVKHMLEQFKKSIQEHRFPHYLMKKRNLLHNIPPYNMNQVLKVIHVMLEGGNLLFHLIRIFKTLIPGKNFFPRFEFDLFERLLTEKSVIGIIHGVTSMPRGMSSSQPNMAQREDENEEAKILREYRNAMVNKANRFEHSMSTSSTMRREPQDPTEMTMPKMQRLEPARLGQILNLFCRHFLRMAEKCIELDNNRQAQVYLSHTDNLAVIMSENCEAYRDYARDIQATVLEIAATQPRRIEIVVSRRNSRQSSSAATEQESAGAGASASDAISRLQTTVSVEIHRPPSSGRSSASEKTIAADQAALEMTPL